MKGQVFINGDSMKSTDSVTELMKRPTRQTRQKTVLPLLTFAAYKFLDS